MSAERIVSGPQAASLIERQFPDLAPARLAPLGEGRDNTAYLVNARWVFRFPRRELAAGLIETEAAVLPAIAPGLPLPVPVPVLVGRPDQGYPWPFAAYELIPGRTLCRAGLDEERRIEAAPVIASFLRVLHGVDCGAAARLGARPDAFRKLDVPHRTARITERLGRALDLGLVESAAPALRVIEQVPAGWSPGTSILVHGDLYVRHVLVDDAGRPCGVIDWGDLHLGDPAVDLSIAWGLGPPALHAAFLDAYGPVSEETWRMARFRALFYGVALLVSGHEASDADLVREGRATLRHVTEAP